MTRDEAIQKILEICIYITSEQAGRIVDLFSCTETPNDSIKIGDVEIVADPNVTSFGPAFLISKSPGIPEQKESTNAGKPREFWIYKSGNGKLIVSYSEFNTQHCKEDEIIHVREVLAGGKDDPTLGDKTSPTDRSREWEELKKWMEAFVDSPNIEPSQSISTYNLGYVSWIRCALDVLISLESLEGKP